LNPRRVGKEIDKLKKIVEGTYIASATHQMCKVYENNQPQLDCRKVDEGGLAGIEPTPLWRSKITCKEY
jgi:hypothetical protein